LNQKVLAAVVAVVTAMTGIVTGMKWMTVAALAVWVAAMLYFGFGDRRPGRENQEVD
jgi:hypothetical protein